MYNTQMIILRVCKEAKKGNFKVGEETKMLRSNLQSGFFSALTMKTKLFIIFHSPGASGSGWTQTLDFRMKRRVL